MSIMTRKKYKSLLDQRDNSLKERTITIQTGRSRSRNNSVDTESAEIVKKKERATTDLNQQLDLELEVAEISTALYMRI